MEPIQRMRQTNHSTLAILSDLMGGACTTLIIESTQKAKKRTHLSYPYIINYWGTATYY
jgi:hypothetical protein